MCSSALRCGNSPCEGRCAIHDTSRRRSARSRWSGQARGAGAEDLQVAAVGLLAQREDGEQAALAAPGRPEDADQLPGGELGVDARAGRGSRRSPTGRSGPAPSTAARAPGR